MKLAAHLCGERAVEILAGDTTFLSQVEKWGFKRIQINATAVNGCDPSTLKSSVDTVIGIMLKFPNLEFMIQRCDETTDLWAGLINHKDGTPKNMSLLMDESKGLGILATEYTSPKEIPCKIGYAGGIGPLNINNVLDNVINAVGDNETEVWIDMESRIRSKTDGVDVFDLNKCFACVRAAVARGVAGGSEM